MSTEEDKARIKETFAAMDKAQDMGPFGELVAPDYVVHFPGMPPSGPDEMAGIGNAFYAGFPGMTHTIHELVAEGDMLAMRMTIAGTHDATFVTPQGEIPATGKRLTLEVLNLFRMSEGRPIEHWVQFDMMSFMQQITPS